MRKGKMPLMGYHHDLIKAHHVNGLDFSDFRLPAAICGTCNTVLHEHCAGKFDRKLPDVFNYSLIKVARGATGPCDCLICQISKLVGKQPHPIFGSEWPQKGRPKSTDSINFTGTPGKTTLCSKCFSPAILGQRHACSQQMRSANLQGIVTGDQKLGPIVANSVLKAMPQSSDGAVQLPQARGGRPSTVYLGSEASKDGKGQAELTAQDMAKIQLSCGLSNEGVRKFLGQFKKATGRALLEKDFRKKFNALGQSLSEEFTLTQLTIHQESVLVAHCISLQDFARRVMMEKNMDPDNILIKLGADHGQAYS